MNCPSCGGPVAPARRGQYRVYCSPRCRKRAELDARLERKGAAFAAVAGDAPIADRDEVLRLLSVAIKRGSVTAARILLEELRRDA